MPQAILNTRTGTNDNKDIAPLTGRHVFQSALPHKRSAQATIRALRQRKTGTDYQPFAILSAIIPVRRCRASTEAQATCGARLSLS